ncbi:unnamed protein product, partial [Rotaria sp. Silwood1]
TGKSAHDFTNDSTLSKNTVILNENNEESDEELPIEKQNFKIIEKSDADFDKEELDRFCFDRNENVKLEIERLKKGLKQTKKSSSASTRKS